MLIKTTGVGGWPIVIPYDIQGEQVLCSDPVSTGCNIELTYFDDAVRRKVPHFDVYIQEAADVVSKIQSLSQEKELAVKELNDLQQILEELKQTAAACTEVRVLMKW